MAPQRNLILLGSGGWFPSPARETCCALVRDGTAALLIDIGSGLRRLVENPSLLDDVETLDIVLTHFHLDHLAGIGYLDLLPGKKRLHAPGKWLYGASTRDILSRVIERPILGKRFDQVFSGLTEIDVGTEAVGSIPVALRAQERHSVPTVGIRIGDWLAYCTDTAFDDGTVPFVEGCDHLLHEAWWSSASPRDVDTHTSGLQAGTIAFEAGVGNLCLIHISPLGGTEAVVEEAQRVFGGVQAGQDLAMIS